MQPKSAGSHALHFGKITPVRIIPILHLKILYRPETGSLCHFIWFLFRIRDTTMDFTPVIV